MKSNQNTEKYEDEIDLKSIFITLWDKKIMIISFILIFAILTAIFSVFVISPVYNTKLNIVISMPETYTTRYGEYILPISSNDQYISLITSNDILINTIKNMEYSSSEVSLEKLKERITVENDDKTTKDVKNSFEVTVSADNPEESLKLAQSIYDNYIEFVDVMTRERAISYFINNFSKDVKFLENQLNSKKEILRKNEELLSQTSQLIVQGRTNIELQTRLTSDTNYVMPVESINPNYLKIESDIVENKQYINDLENSIRMDNQYLKELNIEKEAINKYYETGRVEKLESSVIGVVETSIYLPSPPVAPTEKSSPNNTMNTFVGAIIGGIIGVIIALIKEYWINRV